MAKYLSSRQLFKAYGQEENFMNTKINITHCDASYTTELKIIQDIAEATAITHAEKFYISDVMATLILAKTLGNLTLCRAWQLPECLPSNVIVYDIQPGQHHHSASKIDYGFRKNNIPYSICGIIWKKFGHQFLETEIEQKNEAIVSTAWEIMDSKLMQKIDLDVNNQLNHKYSTDVQPLTAAQIISFFNPKNNWYTDEAFLEAVHFSEYIFDNVLKCAISQAWNAFENNRF